MTLISTSIPSLIAGVSQQAPSFKLDTQADEQLNGLSSIVDGLSKRPPTERVKTLLTGTTSPTLASTDFYHTIKYSDDEYYNLIVTPSELMVFDKDGVSKSITTPTGTSPLNYLSGLSTPHKEIGAVTIADHTYIINKTVNVAKDSSVSSTRPHEGIVYVKQGDYKTEYKITITVGSTDYTTTYTTRDSTNAAHEVDVQTTNIASAMYNGLSLPSGVSKSLNGNIIRVYSSTTDFRLDAVDDRGDTNIFAFKGQATDFKKLPPKGPLGFKLKIIGDNSKNQDDYYVELQDPDGYGQYVWKETVADGVEYKIDAATMPHVLIKDPNGTFLFKEAEWTDRIAGDEDTNPFPSFIGQPINDMFFYKNRLGFLSDENIILSEVGDFFNFFHDTTLILSDSSPIDISISTDDVNPLKYAVPFSDSLMIFSDRVQFKLTSGAVLAHDTVSVDVSTRFEADLNAKPKGAATFVFFAKKNGKWAGLMEYFVSSDSEARDAENITSHIPKYIEGGVRKITTSSTQDMVMVLSEDTPNLVYVYNYYWVNGEKKQSAWHTWDLGEEIYDITIVNSKVVILIKRDAYATLETMELSHDSSSVDMAYSKGILLDQRVKYEYGIGAAPTIEHSSNVTPSYYNSKGALVGVGFNAAQLLAYTTANTTETVHAGFPYDFKYVFSKFLLKQDTIPLNPSTLKMKDITVDYSETAEFSVHVTPNGRGGGTGRPTRTQEFNQPLGSGSNIIGSVAVGNGRFKVGVWNAAEHVKIWITNNTPFPCSFQTAEWRATYNKQAKRV
jgi:hypothetical protein